MTFHSSYETNAMRLEMAKQLALRIKEFRFHYFVTLATNHRPMSEVAMRRVLRRWDAEMNRFLVGRRWTRRIDERLVWFAFLEKAKVNPHWHMLVELDPNPQTEGAAKRQSRFVIESKLAWSRLVHTGDADVKPVASQGVIDYVHKELWSADSFDRFVLHKEFWNK